jgi:hypothetical protein
MLKKNTSQGGNELMAIAALRAASFSYSKKESHAEIDVKEEYFARRQ